MNDYIEARLDFEPCNEVITDVASAYLAEVGFESFVADATGLTAYIKAELGEDIDYEALFAGFPFEANIEVKTQFIEGQDWNHEWEKHYFKPIVIGKECVIHSSFHTDVPNCRYDIVIDPKMAFGTGHHATTSLMIQRLLKEDLEAKSVIDMGTGTGILAILAALRGATNVVGIEIDPAAWVNAVDNIKLNGHAEIRLINGDASRLDGLVEADFLLANINRNIILNDIATYAKAMKRGGKMFLSGFYVEDTEMMRKGSEAVGLRYVDYIEQDRWVSMEFIKE